MTTSFPPRSLAATGPAGAGADRTEADDTRAEDGAHTGPGDVAPWSTADPYARALRAGRGPLFLRRADDGTLLPLDIERWCARADAADRSVLARCVDDVLDIGCGPGRLVAALARSGRHALGIDTSPAAVARTRRLGGRALHRSVFDPLPREGRWGSALLMDGNIGIGGDPAALLERVRGVLAPRGVLLAEAAGAGSGVGADAEERVEVCLQDGGGGRSAHFPWARVGRLALRRGAERAGWAVAAEWAVRGRTFLVLRRPD